MKPRRAGLAQERRPIHGWLCIDKAAGLTSTAAVAIVRRLTRAQRVGHAGTLDPLASGVLPLALGEATKTVAYVMDATKRYDFTLRFGEARDTDDAEGVVIATSDARPSDTAIRAALPRFTGTILQTPPRYSAIKQQGRRAYDRARDDEAFELEPRPVEALTLDLVDRPDPETARFALTSGKGFYVRALARDLAVALGTVAYVSQLRRIAVGRFTVEQAISLDGTETEAHTPALVDRLLPIETVLDDIPALALTEAEAHRLRHGQAIALITRQDLDRLTALTARLDGHSGTALALLHAKPVALVHVGGAEIRPVRLLNL